MLTLFSPCDLPWKFIARFQSATVNLCHWISLVDSHVGICCILSETIGHNSCTLYYQRYCTNFIQLPYFLHVHCYVDMRFDCLLSAFSSFLVNCIHILRV